MIAWCQKCNVQVAPRRVVQSALSSREVLNKAFSCYTFIVIV